MKRYDCQSCGACCIPEYDSDHYVDMTPAEVKELTPYFRKKLVVYPYHNLSCPSIATKKEADTDHTICAAHRGRAGVRSACAIYADRPGVCREFKPGSPACRQARHEIGLPKGPSL